MTEVLVEAGLTLIHQAESSPNMTELARACQVRNGLMVALLALCPIRLKNFVALEIGRSFVQIQGTWWIVLSAEETKENRPDERPVHQLLTPFIDRYLGQHRPVLARNRVTHDQRSGSPQPTARLQSTHRSKDVIKMTTLATVGIAMSPHLFRTSAASTAATHGGDNPYPRQRAASSYASQRHQCPLQPRNESERR